MLDIRDLNLSYGQKQVLKGINLQVAEGEIHGVLGMNGAGKTSLFNLLYGSIRPQSGQCEYKEQPLDPQQIGYLETQNYFYPYLKGGEYLELLSLARTEFDISRWNQLFELPLEGRVDQYSTGMKKKLAFLGILALDRPILILDEPFNGVDVESNEKMEQILKRLRQQGKIILLSSHIISGLTSICDRISYLSEGRFQRTYEAQDFPQLEQALKTLIEQQIRTTLDELLPQAPKKS